MRGSLKSTERPGKWKSFHGYPGIHPDVDLSASELLQMFVGQFRRAAAVRCGVPGRNRRIDQPFIGLACIVVFSSSPSLFDQTTFHNQREVVRSNVGPDLLVLHLDPL